MGHGVLTMNEDGKSNIRYSDEDVLADATIYQRAVLTINRKHFKKLHHEQPNHEGIILCSYDPDFHSQAVRIHELIMAIPELTGQLLRVNRM